MGDSAAHLADIFSLYMGIILSIMALAALLLLNQVILGALWQFYPTRAQYLAAHPDCDGAGGITCNRCGAEATYHGVRGKGTIYRCNGCETELFRVDSDECD